MVVEAEPVEVVRVKLHSEERVLHEQRRLAESIYYRHAACLYHHHFVVVPFRLHVHHEVVLVFVLVSVDYYLRWRYLSGPDQTPPFP